MHIIVPIRRLRTRNSRMNMEERDRTVRQFFGMSQQGNLKEAVRGLVNPQLIMLMSNSSQFEKHVKELEEMYPEVPSIGCIGMSYDTKGVVEQGVGVVAFMEGVNAAANVLEQVSVMPVKYIGEWKRICEKSAVLREIPYALIFAPATMLVC